jgi:hypothetical protein
LETARGCETLIRYWAGFAFSKIASSIVGLSTIPLHHGFGMVCRAGSGSALGSGRKLHWLPALGLLWLAPARAKQFLFSTVVK